MRITLALFLWTTLAVANLPAATIQFKVTNSGSNSFRYDYFVSGITFQANQELDIRFDPTLYGMLSNPVAGPGFQATVLEPNNPPGTFGDYSAFALVNNPSLAGPFSVDFMFKGAIPPGPGSQPFFINQFDRNGNFLNTIESGTTSLLSTTTGVPEPSSLGLCGLAFFIGILWTVQNLRRSRLVHRD